MVFNIPLPWQKVFDVYNDLQNVTKSHDRGIRIRGTKSLYESRISYVDEKETTFRIPNHLEYFQRTTFTTVDDSGDRKFRNLLGFVDTPTIHGR